MLPRLSSTINFTAIAFNSLRSFLQSSLETIPPTQEPLMETQGDEHHQHPNHRPKTESWTTSLLSSMSSSTSNTVRSQRTMSSTTATDEEQTQQQTTCDVSITSMNNTNTAQANISPSNSLSSIPEEFSTSALNVISSKKSASSSNDGSVTATETSSNHRHHFYPSPPSSFTSGVSSRSPTPTSFYAGNFLKTPIGSSSQSYYHQQQQTHLKITRKANLASSPVPIALCPKVLHPVYDGVDCKTTKEYDSHITLGKSKYMEIE